MIESFGELGFYRHSPPILSSFVKHIAIQIGGATHHAAAQARVVDRLPDNSLRLIIGARRANRDSRDWHCSSRA